MTVTLDFAAASVAFEIADHAWGRELVALFGRAAGNVRYTKQGRGEEGSQLRQLYTERTEAQRAWDAARDAGRVAQAR